MKERSWRQNKEKKITKYVYISVYRDSSHKSNQEPSKSRGSVLSRVRFGFLFFFVIRSSFCHIIRIYTHFLFLSFSIPQNTLSHSHTHIHSLALTFSTVLLSFLFFIFIFLGFSYFECLSHLSHFKRCGYFLSLCTSRLLSSFTRFVVEEFIHIRLSYSIICRYIHRANNVQLENGTVKPQLNRSLSLS